jgi:putative SOS response-associated peptidase YedK
MCGRFTLRTPMTVLVEQFQLSLDAARQLALFEPRYNIAPTQEVVVVRIVPDNRKRDAALLRWGLIPSWSKEPQTGPPLINARGETVANKPSFRSAMRNRRCLIPADGFFEWQQPGITGSVPAARGKKQPYYIHFRDDRPFAFAGLWESWTSKDARSADSLTIESCTIITTSASEALSALHDRMPVILAPGDYDLWLDPKIEDPACVAHLIAPTADADLIAEPVSTHVNRVANDDLKCIRVERALFD